MEKSRNIIQVDEELLGEMITKYTRSKENTTSNFMQQFSNTLTLHTDKINSLIEMTKENTKTISELSLAQADSEGSKKTMKFVIGTLGAVFIGLIGIIYTFQTQRIDKVEAQLTSIYEVRK